jgi:hypothetical protein
MLIPAFLLAATVTVSDPAPAVAVFREPDFPYDMAGTETSPRLISDLFEECGFRAVELSLADLCDPDVFSAEAFSAYIHPYGNTYPLEALESLRAFHRGGGSLVCVSGVPFCHPVVASGAAGWGGSTETGNGRWVSAARTGGACWRISRTSPDGWSGPATGTMPTVPGAVYRVSGWVRMESPPATQGHPKSCLCLRFYDAHGQFIGQDGPPLPGTAADWTEMQREVAVPDGAVTMDVCPQLWGAGTVLLDDLSLVRVGQGNELLDNASFERSAAGWVDLGHDGAAQTHDRGLGTGGFREGRNPGPLRPSRLGRDVGLDTVDWESLAPPAFVQVLDPDSLPAGDRVLPLVVCGDGADPMAVAVLVEHGCVEYGGAVDLWCRSHCSELVPPHLYHVMIKGTIEALRRGGRLTNRGARALRGQADAVLGRLHRRDVVPVQEPNPYGEEVWPRSAAPARVLDVVDVSSQPPDVEFALGVLQGLVNREQPRLFLLHSRYADQDRQWLAEVERDDRQTREISIDEAWAEYGSTARGRVLYDPAIFREIGAYHADTLNLSNIVLMLCAVHDAVPFAVGAESPVSGSDLPVVFDVRERWPDPASAYAWAFENLWPQLNHHVLATLYPGIFYLTDYLVQHRVFTFWFPSDRTLGEQWLLEDILAATPPNTPILGWWFCWMPNVQDPAHRAADCVGEGPGVNLGSRYGKFLTPSHECGNLSVLSGMPLHGLRHKPIPDPERLDPGKVYYSFIISDGDNLGECLMLRRRGPRWDVPNRGELPLGWSFAPAAAVLAPPVLDYYLRTAGPGDLLVGGLGIAYTQPDVYAQAFGDRRPAILEEYARMTARSLEPLDTGALWLIGGPDRL